MGVGWGGGGGGGGVSGRRVRKCLSQSITVIFIWGGVHATRSFAVPTHYGACYPMFFAGTSHGTTISVAVTPDDTQEVIWGRQQISSDDIEQ